MTALDGRRNRGKTAALTSLARAVSDFVRDADGAAHRSGHDLLAELDDPACLAQLATLAGDHRGRAISVGTVRDRGPELVRHYGLVDRRCARARAFALLAAEMSLDDGLRGFGMSLRVQPADLAADLSGVGDLLHGWAVVDQPELARVAVAALESAEDDGTSSALPAVELLLRQILAGAGADADQAGALARAAGRGLRTIADGADEPRVICGCMLRRARELGCLPVEPWLDDAGRGESSHSGLVRLLLLADLGLVRDERLAAVVRDLADELAWTTEND